MNRERETCSDPFDRPADWPELLLYRPEYSDAHFAWVRPERQVRGNVLVRDPIEPKRSWWIKQEVLQHSPFRQTTHPRVFICARAVAERDFRDCVVEHEARNRRRR